VSQVRAARLNQWVVSGQSLSGPALDQAAREVFRSAARSIYDLYHYLPDPQATGRLIDFSPAVLELIERSRTGRAGVVAVGVHLSSFDFALRAATLRGLQGLVLTLPELPGAYRREFEMRQALGMEILPASVSALRQAVERLQAGGAVLTGLDRPQADPKYRPRFFGQPSALPVHHIYLALKAGVPVVVAAITAQADGRYHFRISEPIAMQPHPDRQTEMLRNAEAVLEVAEAYIRGSPRQWAMFQPVWPQYLEHFA
jgi:lauroyl/myristoyl acyltransferase